jgi:hypothetical protein
VTGTIILPVIAALLAGMTAASAQQKPTIAGDYTATVDPSFTLRLHLKLSADSVVTGSIDIPDEYEVGDALKGIRFDGHTLRFSVTGHTGFWEGTFAADGNSLNGKWSEEGYLTPELFTRDTPPLQGAKPSPVDGIWLGTLPAGNAPVRIQLIVKSDPTGRISCTMDSPDQRVMGMPCAHVLLSGDSFSFDIPVLSAQWSGKLAENGKTLTGTLTKDAAMPLIFQRQSAALPATAKPAPIYDAAPSSRCSQLAIGPGSRPF